MLIETDILLALRNCYDPVFPCNIVDLGTNIPGVPQKHRIEIGLIPTQTDEAANSQLKAQIENRLAGLETVGQTIVTLLEEPVWSPQQITPTGRKTLGLDGNPNLIQIR
jgi:metal-sulfur cluster biosynthetic enzyme